MKRTAVLLAVMTLALLGSACGPSERERQERRAAEMRRLNKRIELENDELALKNARLAADIARLQGKKVNSFEIQKWEAIVSADRLAESLERDQSDLQEILKH